MSKQTPFEKFADQVLVVLADYSKSIRNLTEDMTRREIAGRIVENGKVVRAYPTRIAGYVRIAIDEVLAVYEHKPKALESFGNIVSLKNEVVDATKMVIEDKIPGGTSPRKPQQFALFVGTYEGAQRMEDELNKWARGEEQGKEDVEIPHIKRTQLAMATDTREGGNTILGVLVSYEEP